MRTTTIFPLLQIAAYAQFVPHWTGIEIPDELPPLPTLDRRQQASEPCDQVAASWEAAQAQGIPAQVPADLAYSCLQSVPVDVEGDLLQIEQLREYLQFHSTLAYLKAGVEGQIEPYDILGQLDLIAEGVQNGTYTSEYDVQTSVRTLLDGAGDFHLFYRADITIIFNFFRGGADLVSLSTDGLAVPELYLYSDLKRANGTFSASPVVSINRQNASHYVEQYSSVGNPYHDVDARYNQALNSPARGAYNNGSSGLFSLGYVYDGATTNFTFANGTTIELRNMAFIGPSHDFTNVTDGVSFFNAFCTGPPTQTEPTPEEPEPSETTEPTEPTESITATSTPTASPAPTLVGYPNPDIIADSKVAAGYKLDGNYSDVAVLFLPSMINPNFSDGQEVVRLFLSRSTQQKKKKLIIDLRGNGGGTIDFGFEVFKQLFPSLEPYGGARYRAHEAFHDYSAALADLAVNGTAPDGEIDGTSAALYDDADLATSTPLLWRNILDANHKPYGSFDDYYGPDVLQNDTFTNIRRYNFTRTPGGHTFPANLTGYGVIPSAEQPFKAEDIVILQDGACGSTCAIFAELMREQGRVQTIAIGGRPVNGPMQGVGGSKGSQVLRFDGLLGFANATININAALGTARKFDDSTATGRLVRAEQVIKRVGLGDENTPLLGSVNALNNLREGDEINTPLEFVYEAADCRLFYTRETWSDPRALWKRIVDVRWRGGKCVEGSTGDSTAIGVIDQKGKNATWPGGNNTAPIQSNAGSSLGVSAQSLVFVVAAVAITLVS